MERLAPSQRTKNTILCLDILYCLKECTEMFKCHSYASLKILLAGEYLLIYYILYLSCTHTYLVHIGTQYTHLPSAYTYLVHTPTQCIYLPSTHTYLVHILTQYTPTQCIYLPTSLHLCHAPENNLNFFLFLINERPSFEAQSN